MQNALRIEFIFLTAFTYISQLKAQQFMHCCADVLLIRNSLFLNLLYNNCNSIRTLPILWLLLLLFANARSQFRAEKLNLPFRLKRATLVHRTSPLSWHFMYRSTDQKQ